jgi:prepilin-type N-terminal cleavage/methylation domain-containing protein
MLRILRRRDGLTLVELIAVLAITAAIVAVFAPSFASALGSVQGDTATMELRAAGHAARRAQINSRAATFPDDQELAAAIINSVPGVEAAPGDASSATADAIAFAASSDRATLTLYTRSSSGTVYQLVEDGSAALPDPRPVP